MWPQLGPRTECRCRSGRALHVFAARAAHNTSRLLGPRSACRRRSAKLPSPPAHPPRAVLSPSCSEHRKRRVRAMRPPFPAGDFGPVVPSARLCPVPPPRTGEPARAAARGHAANGSRAGRPAAAARARGAKARPLVISTHHHHHHPLSTPHGDGGAGEPAHAAVDTRRARPACCEPSRRQAALSARRAKGRPSGRRAPPAGGPPAMSFLVAQRTALQRRAARAAEGTCTERRRETRATWQLGGRAAAGRGRRCRSREREGRCPRRDVSARTQRHWKPAQLLEIWLNLPARIKMVEPHYVMHGADPVPESSSARSRAGGRAAPELTRPTAPPPPPTKERGGYGPAAAAASARAGVQRARPPACSGRPRRL